ncbi:MAG: hypothetical protein ACXAC5_05580 [Promethearchaeota archaeon]|jgi:hypothetical protein
MNDPLLACPYCGDTMDMPSPELLERFGQSALECCDFEMIKLDKGNLYKLLKGLDKLKTSIEHEITKDF